MDIFLEHSLEASAGWNRENTNVGSTKFLQRGSQHLGETRAATNPAHWPGMAGMILQVHLP